jgi:hypothetical protein
MTTRRHYRVDWSEILERWRERDVPEVDLLPFDFSIHYPGCPWYSRIDSHQLVRTTGPRFQTAGHLVKLVESDKANALLALKLLTVCREAGVTDFPVDVLGPVFAQVDLHISSWWDGNARHLLPPLDWSIARPHRLPSTLRPDWPTIVDVAANRWTQVAHEWAVIKIPDFLDSSDPVRIGYEEWQDRLAEERERREYERLKAKFERD